LWAWNVYNTFFIPADFSFYNHPFFGYLIFNLTEISKAYVKAILPFFPNWVSILACSLFFAGVIRYGLRNVKSFAGLVMCLLLTYTFGYAAMGGNLNSYDIDRYLSVIIPGIFFFLVLLFQKLLMILQSKGKVIAIVIAVLWFSYPMWRTVKNTIAWHKRSCTQNIL
jgi:hypothetical protein